MTMQNLNRAGYKVTTRSSSGTEIHYATPRVIQTLMHWYYRCTPPEDPTFSAETDMLVAAGMMKDVKRGLPGLALTGAGEAWVRAILEMPPPIPSPVLSQSPKENKCMLIRYLDSRTLNVHEEFTIEP